MGVEIRRSIVDEGVVFAIYIDGELPDISELASIKVIDFLSIKNVNDSKKLQEFLSTIPIDTIKEVHIISCNMEAVEIDLFEHLENMTYIVIQDSQGINYDEVLSKIPDKKHLKGLELSSAKKEKSSINLKLLKEFENLELLGLINFEEMDMKELRRYLLATERLRELLLGKHFEDLDFILDINPNIDINLIDENFDFSLVTKEVAKSHMHFGITSLLGDMYTKATNDGSGYELHLNSEFVKKKIDSIRNLIDDADLLDLIRGQICIDNADEVKSIIQQKDILQRVPELSIRIPHIAVIGINEFKRLKKEFSNLKSIIVLEPEYEEYENADTVYEYTVEEYEILQSKIQEIISDIPKNFSDLQRFMVIYKRLGEKITYDYRLLEESIREKKEWRYKSDYVEKNRCKGRNLVNGLIKGNCVCVGYAEILYNCLKSVGIEVCKISSKNHCWNKVKLDGVWYNVDLTNDCKGIVSGNVKELRGCLRSDRVFQEDTYKQTGGRNIQCDKDYPRKKVKEAFKFASRFEREEVVLDEENQNIAQEPSPFSRLKARIMMLFGKRKMLEAPQEAQSIPSESERRKAWTEKSGVVLDNGAEISRVDSEQLAATSTPNKDNEYEQE